MKLPALPPRPSRDDRTLLPALLAVVLVVMLALQFVLPGVEELPSTVGRLVSARTRPVAVSRVTADPVILRDPLFSPSRGGAGGGVAGVSEGPLDGASVVGMVRVGNRARAMIQQNNGSAVSIAIGGRYQGWTLVALSTTAARFQREGEQLSMAFAAGPNVPNTNARQRQPEEE